RSPEVLSKSKLHPCYVAKPLVCFDLLTGFNDVEFRNEDVHQNDIRRVGQNLLDRLPAVPRSDDTISGILKNERDQFARIVEVVHDENRDFRHGPHFRLMAVTAPWAPSARLTIGV